jgi:hypothetical protein
MAHSLTCSTPWEEATSSPPSRTRTLERLAFAGRGRRCRQPYHRILLAPSKPIYTAIRTPQPDSGLLNSSPWSTSAAGRIVLIGFGLTVEMIRHLMTVSHRAANAGTVNCVRGLLHGERITSAHWLLLTR